MTVKTGREEEEINEIVKAGRIQRKISVKSRNDNINKWTVDRIHKRT